MKNIFEKILISFLVIGSVVMATDVQLPASALPATQPAFRDVPVKSHIVEEMLILGEVQSSLFKDTVIIDFEKRQITFVQFDEYSKTPSYQYHYKEFDEYFEELQKDILNSLWRESRKDMGAKKKRRDFSKLELALPIHYPAWARRILGKEPPKLSIKGFQSLILGYESRKSDLESAEFDEYQDSKSRGLKFDYENEFIIRGSVGRLLNIEIKAGKNKNNMDEFNFKDQLKKFKIEYKADPDSANQLEDEIIQEATVGYTNFQMPGQGLAGFSGSHEGLFGIKIRSQLGPLSLTTIMSRENVSTKKDTINPSQDVGTRTISELDYVRNVFFFLDTLYWQKYVGITQEAPEIIDFRVYKLEQWQKEGDNPQDFVYARLENSESNEEHRLRTLYEYDEHYKYDKRDGWVQFVNEMPADDDVIAIYLRTKENVISRGDTTPVGFTTNNEPIIKLWILKNRKNATNNPADLLMWRNVYSMENARKETFKLNVYRKVPDKELGDERKNADTLFSLILGLTNNEGIPHKGDEYIYDFDDGYLIFPPFVDNTQSSPRYSNQPFTNPALNYNASLGKEDNVNSKIYYDDSLLDAESKFNIVSSGSSSQQTRIQICWGGIMPNSETLTNQNGEKLEKDVDYYIEYEIGSVELLSTKAKSAQKIYVEYQQESLFMFESKTFLGAYGKLDLPNVGRDSYLATTIMAQFVSAKDKIPKVGTEPFNRYLFDANAHFDFEPEWMTKLINAIPLISTNSTSSATIDLEVAGSRVVPDKENKGEAYLDNFQSSEINTNLFESHRSWFKASPSGQWIDDNEYLYHPPAWRSYWYAPVTGFKSKRWELTVIDDDRENPNRNEEDLSSLRLVVQPLPDTNSTLWSKVTNPGDDSVLVNPWAGVMYPLSSAHQQDRSKDRYFEFWVKCKKGVNDKGVLYVDFGQVSQDLSLDGGPPDGFKGSERRNTYLGEYKKEFDLGIDERPDDQEYYVFPNVNTRTWDTLGYNNPLLGEFSLDPSRDNYRRYYIDSTSNYPFTNGTENSGKPLTSEHVLEETDFIKKERYYRLKIDLANIDKSPHLDTAVMIDSLTNKYNWYAIRIPITDSTIFDEIENTPNWKRTEFVRLLWTDFNLAKGEMAKEYQLEFSGMKFTGNRWIVVPTGDSAIVKINPSLLDSYDDRGTYIRPWGVDSLDKEKNKIKDIALRLEYENILSGEEALIKRIVSAYQKIDLSNYEDIRFYILERDKHIWRDPSKTVDLLKTSGVLPQDRIHFVFRFGRSDSCYYEYRTNSLDNHWARGRGVRINLKQLSDLKLAYIDKYGERSGSIDTSVSLPDGSRIQVYSKTNDMPLFSDIKWMALGVMRPDGSNGLADGEIWVHGLRVKGLKPLKGWAFRADLKTQWADFMDFSANFSYDDADFRQMSEDALIQKGAGLSAGINAQWQVSKFLPEKWGINIPVGTGVMASLARPKQRPGSDISLTDDNRKADGFSEMAKDFSDLIFNTDLQDKKTKAEHYEKNSVNKSWYTSYSKTVDSENPFVNLTADRITANYNYTRDSTTELRGRLGNERDSLSRKNVGEDHILVNSSRTHGASVKYDLTPRNRPKWTEWAPFEKVKAKRFPSSLKDYRLQLLPDRLNFDVFEGSYKRFFEYESLKDIEDSTGSSARNIENLGLTHGMQFSYSPISSLLETGFDVSINRDFNEILSKWHKSDTREFIREKIFSRDGTWGDYYIFTAENNRTQNANIRLDPRIFDWISHTAEYRNRYQHSPKTLDGRSDYLNSKVNSEFNFSSNFRIRSLFSSMSEATEKAKGLSNVFDILDKGFDKIGLSAINFNYNASLDLNNDFLDTDFLKKNKIKAFDFLKYQLGAKGRDFKDVITGNIDDYNTFGGPRFRTRKGYDYRLYKNDSRVTHQDYKVSTSLRLPRPLDITLSPLSLGWRNDFQRTHEETFLDSTRVFPEFQIGASTNILEKIPLVKQFLNNLGLNSAYNFSKTERYTFVSSSDLTKRKDLTIGHSFSPLVSLNGQMKKRPINIDYTFSFSVDSTSTYEGDNLKGEGKKTRSSQNDWSFKYDIPGKTDREFKLFRNWVVQVKGDISMGMTVNFNATRVQDYEQNKEWDNWLFKVHPLVTYDFTDNIDGKVEYIYEKEYDGITDEKKTFNRFALTVTIYFK